MDTGNLLGARSNFYRVMNQSLAVCHHLDCCHFILLPMQCLAILGSVIPPPSPHLSMPEMPDKRTCEKMLYFPQLGWRIYYRNTASSSTLSCSALRKIPAESRSLVWSCAWDLKPCLLARFLFLAGDPSRTETNASCPFAKTAYLSSPLHTVCQRFV